MQQRAFYTYLFNFASLAASTSLTVTQNVQADADFDWLKGVYQADIASAAVTDSSRVIPLVNILVLDTSSGYQLSSAAIPIETCFGTGLTPFILPAPYRFRRAGTISITLSNYSAATTYNIRLCLSGVKCYS